MRTHRQLFIMSVLIIALMALGLQPAFGQSSGNGRIIDSYRAGDAKPVPPWAQEAIARGQERLAAVYGNAELAPGAAVLDDLNMRHVRYDQRYQGLPVFGGQVVAHLDAAGNLTRENGRFYKGIGIATKPAIDAGQAIESAQKALGYQGDFAEAPTAQLLVLPQANQYVLAYQVTLKIEDGTDATAHHQFFVNAADGSITYHFNSLPSEGSHRPSLTDAIGSGRSLYSGTVSIHTDRSGNRYYLRDLTRGGMYTTDMNNCDQNFSCYLGGNGSIFTDADNVWGTGTTSSRQSVAVDAHFGSAQTWDYYLNVHGRRGIDGNGYRVISRTHYGISYNNAFWNGSVMTYGDGDGTTFRPLVSIDVVGHEITHGLTERTANLIYEKESGAANESFSDIFGTAVEFYSGGVGGRPADYLIGEDITIQPDAAPGIRNMQDPTEDNDPDHYANRLYPEPCTPSDTNDNCGVHSNSGIQNNAFYLLAQGGTNGTSGLSVTGITRAKAEKIFYRALTVYLFPSANFHDVRVACLSAAADLYGSGSAEYNATAAAWTAVGVN